MKTQAKDKKMKTCLITTVILATLSQAYAGKLICSGPKHIVTINSKSKTILVSPEMKVASPAVIAPGPETGLVVAYDKARNFVIYLGEKDGKISGNLQSSKDQDLEEKSTCTGSL